MKDIGSLMLSKGPFSEIMMGNSAIVRAFIETGTKVITSYPGSPTPEIAQTIADIPRENRPFYFEFSVNEKVALEIAFGASIKGLLSCVFFKSVGLNVASDSFVQLSLLELKGGMVILLGDDPGANSSQNEQDNRHYAMLAYVPVFEPSSVQEAYEMYLKAAELSKKLKMPIILRLTTHVCHQKEKVSFGLYDPSIVNEEISFHSYDLSYVPITETVFPKKRRALEKLEKVKKISDELTFNKNIMNSSERGIITFGLTYLSLMDVLQKSSSKVDILKIGMINPIPEKSISDFLKAHKEVKILEELDNILEEKTKVIAYEQRICTKIIGKTDINDWIGEYTPDKVYEVLRKCWPDLLPERNKILFKGRVSPRPAQMCPGCGHRSAFYAIKKALSKENITVADIGCHTLGSFPPYNMGEVLLSMGHSSATASGLSLFDEKSKVVAFIGDSTLFHAGIPGIINAIYNKHNILLVIMENGTTAMTGHQNHPAVGRNFSDVCQAVPIMNLLTGLGIKNIYESDAYDQKNLEQNIRQALKNEEFSIVIAKHPCMLKFVKEKKRRGIYKNKTVKVISTKCILENFCINDFACPSYQRGKESEVFINEELCIGDGSCLQVCPHEAIGYKDKEEKDDNQ